MGNDTNDVSTEENSRKLRHSSPDSIARAISLLTNPKLTIFAQLLYISAFLRESIPQTICLVVYVAIAAAYLARLKSKTTASDSHEFSDPHHRRIRYLTFTFFIGLSVAFFAFSPPVEQDPFERRYFLVTIAVTTALLFFTWRFLFKLSAHLTFLGLVVLYSMPVGNMKYSSFLALATLVGWARIWLRNHDRIQIATTMSSMIIVYLLWDWWLHFAA